MLNSSFFIHVIHAESSLHLHFTIFVQAGALKNSNEMKQAIDNGANAYGRKCCFSLTIEFSPLFHAIDLLVKLQVLREFRLSHHELLSSFPSFKLQRPAVHLFENKRVGNEHKILGNFIPSKLHCFVKLLLTNTAHYTRPMKLFHVIVHNQF